MSFLRQRLPIILPLLLGAGLLWGLTHWKPLAPLAPIEHALFVFPERFEPDTTYSDRGKLTDYQVTPLSFVGETKSRSLGSYVIDQETRDIIDLTPDKWAYLLDIIRKNNKGLLVITAPLSWPDATELSLQTLEHQISQTPDLVIGLDAEFNNTKAPLPNFLESSVIFASPPESFHLPQIDFLTLSPSIKASLFGISTIQGFVIETSSSGIKIPMLVRWGDSVLPTTHLASLIAAHQLKPSDVIIDSAGYLRLGPHGSIIQIDSQGRALFPAVGNETQSASQILIKPEKVSSSKILLAPNSPQSLTLLETHLTKALSQTPKPLQSYKRWQLPIEISALVILTLLLQARRLWLTLIGIAALFIISVHNQHWYPVSPVALLLISFAILPKPNPKKTKEAKPKKSPPPEPKPDSEPTPDPTPPKKQATKKAASKKTAKKAAKKAARKRPRRKKKKRR